MGVQDVAEDEKHCDECQRRAIMEGRVRRSDLPPNAWKDEVNIVRHDIFTAY